MGEWLTVYQSKYTFVCVFFLLDFGKLGSGDPMFENSVASWISGVLLPTNTNFAGRTRKNFVINRMNIVMVVLSKSYF